MSSILESSFFLITAGAMYGKLKARDVIWLNETILVQDVADRSDKVNIVNLRSTMKNSPLLQIRFRSAREKSEWIAKINSAISESIEARKG